MNEKDKEEFEKWFEENSYDYYGYEKNNQQIGWQAACEYKQKKIDAIMAENAKLGECVESFVDKYFDLPVELRFQKGLKEGKESLRARQVLKELEKK